MTPEAELVVILSRSPLTEVAEARANEVINRGVDWDAAVAWARAFEVEPVFFRNTLRLDWGAGGDEVIADATTREQAARAMSVGACLRVSDICSRLADAGVESIVLKGPAVGWFAYGDPALRTFGDTDLLVRGKELLRAREVLVEAGFSPNYAPQEESRLIAGGHALEFFRGTSYVEIHSTLVESHLGFNLGDDDLWNDAERIGIPGGEVWSLDPARLFLFLCAHGTKHAWSRFRWICDIAQCADRLSLDTAQTIIRLAKCHHAERILGLALALVEQIYGSIPRCFAGYPVDSAARKLAAGCIDALGIAAVVTRGGDRRQLDDDTRGLLFWIRSRERTRDAVKPLLHVLLVPTANDGPGGVLSWVTRPVRLTSRVVFRVLRRSRAR
jgi:hypothetical protein